MNFLILVKYWGETPSYKPLFRTTLWEAVEEAEKLATVWNGGVKPPALDELDDGPEHEGYRQFACRSNSELAAHTKRVLKESISDNPEVESALAGELYQLTQEYSCVAAWDVRGLAYTYVRVFMIDPL